MTAEVVPFAATLNLVGFSDKGTFINLGYLPLPDPTERYSITEALFEEIERCSKAEQMCKIGNISFYPQAFDFFTVK